MNHTKSELEAMSADQLIALAKSVNAELSDDKISLIYNIIDAESVQVSEKMPKKRGRKPKSATIEATVEVPATEE
ncbi:MAG: hypothetical protein HUK03_07010, partial [Bacteroidaceae bacterium]|nr:hypothetical protein [Bacteroidaceae bacterium]